MGLFLHFLSFRNESIHIFPRHKPIIMLYSLLTVAGSLSMAFGDDRNDNELVDRLMSNGYSNVPNGYERTYSRDPYERTYSMANGYDRTYHSDPYERTYSNIPRGYERTYSNLPRG